MYHFYLNTIVPRDFPQGLEVSRKIKVIDKLQMIPLCQAGIRRLQHMGLYGEQIGKIRLIILVQPAGLPILLCQIAGIKSVLPADPQIFRISVIQILGGDLIAELEHHNVSLRRQVILDFSAYRLIPALRRPDKIRMVVGHIVFHSHIHIFAILISFDVSVPVFL